MLKAAFPFQPSKHDEVTKGLHETLKAISVYLGNNNWTTGNQITIVDFWLYETLIWYTRFDKDFLSPYGNFLKFLQRFEELPAIKSYISGPNYIEGPCINPIAVKKI